MYTPKSVSRPSGATGSDSRAVVCSPFQNPHFRWQASNRRYRQRRFVNQTANCETAL